MTKAKESEEKQALKDRVRTHKNNIVKQELKHNLDLDIVEQVEEIEVIGGQFSTQSHSASKSKSPTVECQENSLHQSKLDTLQSVDSADFYSMSQSGENHDVEEIQVR